MITKIIDIKPAIANINPLNEEILNGLIKNDKTPFSHNLTDLEKL